MSWQDGANLLRACQGLVDFHARAAGVGEDGVHPFAFETGHEDFAAGHRGAEFHALGSRRFLLCFSCLAHRHCSCGWLPRVHKKTHSRRPAVGSCRNSSYLRQAPTASPTRTTTSRANCRMFTIIGANLVNSAWHVKPRLQIIRLQSLTGFSHRPALLASPTTEAGPRSSIRLDNPGPRCERPARSLIRASQTRAGTRPHKRR